ncbi:hypothetical protein C2G38_2044951 [Gigaspora rosea]|uniref:Peptidase S1 domain-containing protein n=1 Tax=Gigaspora rosea TaxID=44941 RepID=A0A397UNG1_9GLOM|nr:hypothetical protein C2G38_2044951 [Gigaspora rosea]
MFDLAFDNDAVEVMYGIFLEENNVIVFMYEEYKDVNNAFINTIEEYELKIIFYLLEALGGETLSKPEISMDKRSLDILVLGGDGLFTEHKRCSAGFLATNNEFKSFIVTAEHCRDGPGDETKFFYGAWNEQPMNKLIGSMLPIVFNFYDFGLIDISNMSESLKPFAAIRNAEFEQFLELPIIDSITVSSHDVHLYKSGYSTHVTCGFVKAFDFFMYIRNGTYYTDLIFTSMFSQKGDSGGTAFAYSVLGTVILNGIYVAVFGNVNSVILPLSKITEYGDIEPIITHK